MKKTLAIILISVILTAFILFIGITRHKERADLDRKVEEMESKYDFEGYNECLDLVCR
jgi:hypothetical protein